MEQLSPKDQKYLRGYAQGLQDLMFEVTGENTCGKSYDPIDFDDEKIHSYAFNFKDGGRHHPLSDFKDIEEIKEYMLQEAKEWTQQSELPDNDIIFRIDGNSCFNEPIKGLIGYYKTRESAEKALKERGYYLETRKWDHIKEHEHGADDFMWYNNKLTENGYSYDDTSYAYIKEIKLESD